MDKQWMVMVVVVLALGCGPGGDDDASGGGSAGTADDGSGENGGSSAADSTGEGGDSGPPAYCPGVPEHTQPICRDADDCSARLETCGPDAPVCGGAGGCLLDWGDGPPCATDRECTNLDGAGTDGVCRFGVDLCCGEVASCIAACTVESCSAEETCAADGHCRPIPCDEGFACAPGSTCDPNGGDAHGCVVIPCDQPDALPCTVDHACADGTCQRIPCLQDTDCPCGSCIGSQCWDRPWICYSEPA